MITGQFANRAAADHRSNSGGSSSFDLEQMATMLAVYRISFVPVKATFRTLVRQFVGKENRLSKAQEQCNTSDHDDHCQKPSYGASQHDITKAGGRQCGHSEVKRIDIAYDVWVMISPQHENERTHEEDEDAKID